jgi:ClpP class serine protease
MEPNNDSVFSNRSIDQFILSGEFAIEPNWGMSQLAEYCNELEMLEKGVPYAELGISRRRAAGLASVVTFSNEKATLINNPAMLADASITPVGSYALIRLNGVMRSQDGASTRGIQSIADDFNSAWMNDNIEGILLETNTGGGESVAGQMLKSIIEESPKAVVVFGHLLASAGIHATLTADEIIASSESAQFGSIGTYLTVSKSFASYYTNYYEDIYASKSTNKNKEFREFLKGNKEPLVESVNQSNEYFLKEVQKHRKLKGNVDDTLSGQMFYAKEAKNRGLIDGIGSFQYAISRLKANVKRRKNL